MTVKSTGDLFTCTDDIVKSTRHRAQGAERKAEQNSRFHY